MRVITGTLRGKRLITLEGESVRPTTDKTKEAIFSIIQFDIPNAEVLDLFAGSGQLGIEALSRGAKHCVFVDKSKESIGVIRQNIESCKLENSSRILNYDAEDYLKMAHHSFDIAILDPPYSLGLIPKVLSGVDEIMNPGGTVVCEHEAGLELPEKVGGLTLRRRYSYGKLVALTVYDKDSADTDN
jgi:16S rRNA (guanine966-N2)-methyltransferase